MLSHQEYPPIPLPVNVKYQKLFFFLNSKFEFQILTNTNFISLFFCIQLTPGHSMQQIVDEHGVLKHIIIGPPSNPGEPPIAKNQILTKNGAKLTPFNPNGTRTSSFKKKPSNGSCNESAQYTKPNRFNGLTNDALLTNSTGLLSSNGVVYPLCCCCCPGKLYNLIYFFWMKLD